MSWGVLGCGPNTTGLRVAGGMPGKPKTIKYFTLMNNKIWKR